MSESWPTTLPSTPLVNGYSDVDENTKLSTSVDVGTPKLRNRSTGVSSVIEERYLLTKTQYDTLKNFYRSTLGNGAESFIKQHPIEEINKIYRFRGEGVTLESIRHPYYIVKLALRTLPE